MLPNPHPFFTNLIDPRRSTRNKLHKLDDIVMIVLCATVCGIRDWVGMEDFGHANEIWLRQYLSLPNGIPSHDTLSSVIGRLDPAAFACVLEDWVKAGYPSLNGKHVAVDGKRLCGSHDGDVPAVHLLGAYATKERMVLAAHAIPAKNNEITAMPALLAQLDLRGAIVTIDAMGCQTKIAKAIVDQKADYILALKMNHAGLYQDIKLWLDDSDKQGYVHQHQTVEKNHGRIETRRTVVTTDLTWLTQKKRWPGLTAVAMVESTREVGASISSERRYYLCSVSNVQQIAETIRAHWAIENSQHWVLDVQFGEDANRARKSHSAANLGIIRRMALNLLQADTADKRSIGRRKMYAMTDATYRTRLVFGTTV